MAEHDRLMNTNVRGVMILTNLAVPELVKTKGNVVNISSVAGNRSVSSLHSSQGLNVTFGQAVINIDFV